MDFYDYETEYFDMSKLVVPDPFLEVESLTTEEMVTLNAKLLYELPYFPRGTLAVRHRGQRVYYSVQTTVGHARRDRYLSLKRDADEIDLLCKKKIVRATLKKIRKVSRDLKGYRRRLAAKLAVINRQYAEFYIYYTNKIYVRSTAEAAIVEMLHKRHVRFEYEAPMQIGRSVYHPDFKYVVNGQPVYHEHLGMLNEADYAERWNNRYKRYRALGLVEGVDLLISVSHGKSLNLVEIEQMLHERGVF